MTSRAQREGVEAEFLRDGSPAKLEVMARAAGLLANARA
jgi:hypothetical protein